MALDSELYDWRDRSDIKKMLPANASSLRWCSGNKKDLQNIYISRRFLQCLCFITTLRIYLCRLFVNYASYVNFEMKLEGVILKHS